MEKSAAWSISGLLVILAGLGYAFGPAQEAPPPAEDGAVTINGKAFGKDELQRTLNEEYWDVFLERFILRNLVLEEATKTGVDFEAADKKIEEHLQRAMEHPRIQGDMETLERELIRSGRTLEIWKGEIRVSLLAEQILQKAREIPELQIRRAFEAKYGKDGVKWRVRHIQASVNVNASNLYSRTMYDDERPQIVLNQTAAAEAVLKKLGEGADFGACVLEYSDDRATANEERMGKLGTNWRFFGNEFEEAVGKIPVGEVGGPIRSQQGIHVVKVDSMEPAEYGIQHILISFAPLAALPEAEKEVQKTKLREKAQAILEEARGGKDFGELAKVHSEDRGTKEKGGVVDPYKVPGRFGADFDRALAEMSSGEIRGPLESRAGFHVVKMNSKTVLPSIHHILLSTQFVHVRDRKVRPVLEEEARKKIDRIQALLSDGSGFEAIAAQESDDRATKDKGGEIANYRPEMLGEEFHAVVVGMKPGDPPRVAKSPRGLHLVGLIGVEETKYEDVREGLLEEQQSQPVSPRQLQAYLEELREKADVVIPEKK
jgi:peptidyl-prolyl cis-trans isomerase SurA